METNKRWQLIVIIFVALLTLYNILPTVFYYTKPLKTPIDQERAEHVAESIVERVNGLESEAISWLETFTKHIHVKPSNIELDSGNPRWIKVTFKSPRDAEFFRAILPRAGALIPFVPAQLELASVATADENVVVVERRIGVHFNKEDINKFFQFTVKRDENITPFYRQLVNDRVTEVAFALAGPSNYASQLEFLAQNGADSEGEETLISLAKTVVSVAKTFGVDQPIAKRIFASFTQSDQVRSSTLLQNFISQLESTRKKVDARRNTIRQERESLVKEGKFLDSTQEGQLSILDDNITTIDAALPILKQNGAAFTSGTKPMTRQEVTELLKEGTIDPQSGIQHISIAGHHPFIETVSIDWTDDIIRLKPYGDIINIRSSNDATEVAAFVADKLNNLLINEVARLSRVVDETLSPGADDFSINMNTLTNSQSLLAFNLGEIGARQGELVLDQIRSAWRPLHQDLKRENFPINRFDDFRKLSTQEGRLGLVVYVPSVYEETPPEGFRTSSLYVIARGLGDIIQKYQQYTDSTDAKIFMEDFTALQELLQKNGFIGYPGTSYGVDEAYKNDYIFELGDYFSNILMATREDFTVHGSKRYAVLEFTDVEQRILARNKIGDAIHEDVLKWKEEYATAQVDLNPTNRLFIPPPSKSSYMENLKLSTRKYFRGDDRKILRWGLDLSGGKMVRIGLRDKNNVVVTAPEDLNQAVNELYTRINKMGVAERNIRVENNNIILEFPGSQGLSASELVKASAMYFHIVNEKFAVPSERMGVRNALLGDAVNRFLQEVWNEAVITNRKDTENINEIAWQHLGGEEGEGARPRSEYGQILWNNGLRLASPDSPKSAAFNDTLSSVARFRGDDYSEWFGQTHPLAIVFQNYALEGSSLENIHTGYDQRQGNMLMFGVRRSYEGSQAGSPREDFYNWTSQFSEERIAGTPKEKISGGRGWRLAVILNNEIVSWPTLQAALRDGGTITGRFTQREISSLAADLKAGSLSFTPKILSEQNISPDLGREERSKGIMAAGIGMAFVIIAMISVYHFAGLVASIALFFNLLIIWGVLQNLDAALSLPGIAAMVLTVGMAVDANVLVFERTREEFALSGRIGSALHAGYRKAFSAIVDSNLTTIIAALILIQFDSGPIKGFAITLIIGITSSMFTALFCTRYFFASWVRRTKAKTLSMAHIMKNTSFNFLRWGKTAIMASVILVIGGSFLLIQERSTLFGMDFTGGYALTVDLNEKEGFNYRVETTDALEAAVPSPQDVQVQELSRPNQLRIQLGIALEQQGGPFFGMPEELPEGKYEYSYERNPRIAWVVNTLRTKGIEIQEEELGSLEKNWTSMSGQFSDAMRNNALMALTAALVCILIYITFRFEFKFAISSVIGLAHDVALTLGILALFHWLGAPVQIDLQVVGAIMTIIGYSLNDTIIVFDRVREDVRLMRKASFSEVVNHALNITLSRTLMTSGTTLLVLLALVTLGGSDIFTFSLVMTIGILVGTLSSLFVAAPSLLFFHNREVAKIEKEKALKLQKA